MVLLDWSASVSAAENLHSFFPKCLRQDVSTNIIRPTHREKTKLQEHTTLKHLQISLVTYPEYLNCGHKMLNREMKMRGTSKRGFTVNEWHF